MNDIENYYPLSLIRANLLAARERGDTDPYWNELEKKLEEKDHG